MTNERNLQSAEIPSFEIMVEHNLAKYALASADNDLFFRGVNWYPMAREDCHKYTCELRGGGINLSNRQFDDVVSIISPGRNWRANPKDAFATVLAWGLKQEEERIAVLSKYRVSRRYGLPAFRRAWSLLDGQYVIQKRTAPKTFSFADNLEKCELSSEVTVDQHNCHILLGENDVFGSIGISASQYKRLVAPMYHCAAMVGLHPTQFQSLLWNWRWENMQSI